MLIVPVTRSLIYQAIAKQMARLASPENPTDEYTTVFVDRQDLWVVDDDIYTMAAPVVERHEGKLTRACVDEVGNCGVLAFGFRDPSEAIIFARELEVSLCKAGFEDDISGYHVASPPRVIVWDTKHWIDHDPEAPKRKRGVGYHDR